VLEAGVPVRVSSSGAAEDITARLERMPFLPFHLRIAGMLGAGTLFDAFDSLSIAAALTMIVATFHIDYAIGATLVSAAYIGQIVGAVGFGFVSERIGRKWAYVIAVGIFGACSIGAALATSITGIEIARAIQGLGLGAEVPIAGALFNELVRSNLRGRVIIFYESLFVWGLILAPVAGLVCFDTLGPALGWRALFALGGIPLIAAAIAAFRLPESPRWLASHGRIAEADRIVTAMEDEARKLGKPLPLPVARPPVAIARTRFLELFTGLYLRRTIVAWSQWFCAYFVNTGFAVWTPTLFMKFGGLPVHYALLLTIGINVCGLVTVWLTAENVDRVGRVPWFAYSFLLGTLGAAGGVIAIGVFHAHGWLPLLVFGLIMNAGSAINAIGVYLYTPELYPTRMRGLGTATASSMNRVASTIAPLAVGYLMAMNFGMASVFGMFALVSFIGYLFMQFVGVETKGRILEEVSP
jgi:MFS transporter, putative metabolite:H+ symporter